MCLIIIKFLELTPVAFSLLQDIYGKQPDIVQYVNQNESIKDACDTAFVACQYCSFSFGLPFVLGWLITKLAKTNDPQHLQLSHVRGKMDDVRGPRNWIIAAPPDHTSV